MSRSALFDSEAQKALVKGAHLVRDAVKVTMGPKGKTVVIQQSNNKPPVITKDGVSVAVEIQPKDEKIAIGSQLICSVARKALGAAGDGTSSATVLAGAIIDEGIKYTNTNAALSDIRKGISHAADDVVEELSKLSTPITTDEQLVNVATISANGDTKLGGIVADAYSKVGKDGVVTVEESKERDITLTTTEGMKLNKGWVSQYFVMNNTKSDNVVEYDNPKILLVDSKLNNTSALVRAIEPVASAGTPLVIIAEGFETTILNALLQNVMRGIKICCVEAPGYGERKTEILRDLGYYIGATVADDVMSGKKLEQITDEDLGSCAKIIIGKDSTVINGGKGDPVRLQERIESIKSQIAIAETSYDSDKLRERLGSLTTGIATIHVGGSSEEEIKELKDRLDDAMWSTKSALEEGFVPGSGRTLEYLSNNMDFDEASLTDDEKIGIQILKKAMKAPFKTILENADENSEVISAELKSKGMTDGYNVATMQPVNLIDAGIIDATKVVRSALQAAASIASLILTTNVVITQDPEENKNPMFSMPMM